MSSTAALTPLQIPQAGADIKRHQSLNQGYGRLRERLDKSPALLTIEQRAQIRKEEEPPTSPIGQSVWSVAQSSDEGWNRPTIQSAFDALQIGARIERPRSAKTSMSPPPLRNSQDEPSWVASLVGPDRHSPHPRPYLANPYIQAPYGFKPQYQPWAYPTPPVTAVPPHDQAVIDLARSKGLNPATFDCRPPQARFFVIKSYTVRRPWLNSR